jgi:hypothetical protein
MQAGGNQKEAAVSDGHESSVLGDISWVDLALKVFQTLSLAGLALYAIVRSGYDAFYSRLGATPEEVGVTQVTIISQAALGLIFLSLLLLSVLGGIGLIVGVFWAGFEQLIRFRKAGAGAYRRPVTFGTAHASRPAQVHYIRPMEPLALILATLLVALATFAFGLYVDRTYGRYGLLASDFVLWLLILPALASLVTLVLWTFSSRRDVQRIIWAARLAAVVGLAYGGFSLTGVANSYGQAKGQEESNGQLQELPTMGDLFQFQVQPVCVIWAASDPKPKEVVFSRTLDYLGRSDGELVLYRSYRSTEPVVGGRIGIVRLPAAKVVMNPVAQPTDPCPQ